jgi:hypothetical protein
MAAAAVTLTPAPPSTSVCACMDAVVRTRMITNRCRLSDDACTHCGGAIADVVTRTVLSYLMDVIEPLRVHAGVSGDHRKHQAAFRSLRCQVWPMAPTTRVMVTPAIPMKRPCYLPLRLMLFQALAVCVRRVRMHCALVMVPGSWSLGCCPTRMH